jgi:4-hydroxy-tetrahydrodipicolinate synthase
LVGKEIAEMVNAFHAGNAKKATDIHLKLLPLFKVLFITSNPSPVKYALEQVGFPVGKVRLPLVEPSDQQKEEIKKVMGELGLIQRK